MRLVKVFCKLSILLLLFFFQNDSKAQKSVHSASKLNTIQLTNLQGKKSQIKLDKPVVIIFLSPECPLCKNYLPGLVKLKNANSEITFYGIIPGNSYSLKDINDLKNEYSINFILLKDSTKQLSNYLTATTTPEVVLINKMGAITYRGLIDNWVSSLGKKRSVITEKYLEQAIADLLSGKQTFKETTPIGCLINDI